MSARIRLTKHIISSRAEAETVLGELAAAQAAQNYFAAEMDQRLTETRQAYESKLDTYKRTIEAKTSQLQQWAEANPEEFGDKKSIDLVHGRLGFRTGTPKLKTLAGWTWEKVKGVLAAAFVRSKSEVDKEGLLAAYARHEITDSELRKLGLRVDQEEGFFIEPKLEEVGGDIRV